MAQYIKDNGEWKKIGGVEKYPADFGTRAKFETMKDDLPVGTVFTTTDEFEDELKNVAKFPDYAHPLTTSAGTWVAPVDCYLELIVVIGSTGGTLYIDGVDVRTQYFDGSKTYNTFHGYVKKGSVVTGDQIGSLDGRIKAYPLI